MRTFIVRLHEDPGGTRPDAAPRQLRGFVDEVATGLRATFRTDHELVTALLAAVGSGSPDPIWIGGNLAPGEPASQ